MFMFIITPLIVILCIIMFILPFIAFSDNYNAAPLIIIAAFIVGIIASYTLSAYYLSRSYLKTSNQYIDTYNNYDEYHYHYYYHCEDT